LPIAPVTTLHNAFLVASDAWGPLVATAPSVAHFLSVMRSLVLPVAAAQA